MAEATTEVRGHPSTERRRFDHGRAAEVGGPAEDAPPGLLSIGAEARREARQERGRGARRATTAGTRATTTRARSASSSRGRAAPAPAPAPSRRRRPRSAVGRLFTPARAPGGRVITPSTPQQVVLAEFVAFMFVVILRGLADYQPASDESQPGTVETPKGLGPFVLAAAGAGWFFVLSFVATTHRKAGTAAAWLGAATLVTLLFNSHAELAKVGHWIDSLGMWSPASPQAQTTTPVPAAPAGQAPVSGVAPGAPAGWREVPNTQGAEVYARNGKCPAGWTLYRDRCIAPIPAGPPMM